MRQTNGFLKPPEENSVVPHSVVNPPIPIMSRLFLILVFATTVVLTAQRPNILLIYTDDQSHRTVGCYPESFDWVRTPNIDSLARNGVRFAHAYIGKWHTGTDTGMGLDWDYQIVWNRPGFTDNSRNYFNDQMITFNNGQTRLVEGYSTDNYTKWAIEFIKDGKGRKDETKPWYLWLCYGAVHGPYTPAPRHVGDYTNAVVPIPKDIFDPRPGKPSWLQNRSAFRERDGEIMSGKMTFADAVRQYHEGVLAIDEGVGRLVAALKESGQLENTLVVFTSDQGFAWGQHGVRSKLAGYDATIRAPLIISMPGSLPRGQVCERPVGGVDLIPTFHRFAGIELPWQMHGHDLTPLLRNPQAAWKHPVLIANTWNSFGSDTAVIPADGGFRAGIPWYVMLRHGRYKYIHSLLENEPARHSYQGASSDRYSPTCMASAVARINGQCCSKVGRWLVQSSRIASFLS
ncbi:MAG: sulfatase [Verrucomicrobiales bacterium]|nr:sulfatase [Verrucomicrobiales bacterium]